MDWCMGSALAHRPKAIMSNSHRADSDFVVGLRSSFALLFLHKTNEARGKQWQATRPAFGPRRWRHTWTLILIHAAVVAANPNGRPHQHGFLLCELPQF